jgi:hypothetical protein
MLLRLDHVKFDQFVDGTFVMLMVVFAYILFSLFSFAWLR